LRSYKESSLLVEVFTRAYGRFTVIAKGCRRKKTRSQGMFIPFKPVLISWTGKGELPILTSIEQLQYFPQLSYANLSCGYYMNELIIRLLHRHDPHEVLYDKYEDGISALSKDQNPYTVLRIFEKYFLQEIGFGLVLDHDVETGEEIIEERDYRYHPEKGPVLAQEEQVNVISGTTLIALRKENFSTDIQQSQAQQLTRQLINIQLAGKTLKSRKVLQDIRRYEEKFRL